MRKLTEADMIRSGIPRRQWGAKWREVQEGPHRANLERYLVNLNAMTERGVGFLLWGPNGVGKTALACILLMQARRFGYPTLFLSAADLKQKVFGGETFDGRPILERIKSVSVLVIDDLGKGVTDSKGQGSRLLDDIVRSRNAAMLVTHMTTNMSPVRDENGTSPLEDVLKTSSIHAMKESILHQRVTGEDFRDGRRKEILEDFLQAPRTRVHKGDGL